MKLSFNKNRANAHVIETHLRNCDTQFLPHLSVRVDLTEYCTKLAASAVLCEAWAENTLVGLVAGYANSPKLHDSFITNVSVQPNWHGMGIAERLLEDFIDHAYKTGFSRVVLRVDARNDRALSLYRKHGFIECRSVGTNIQMYFCFNAK